MKFACIEYTTKTGAIWRHRPERPNYLCDPNTEIDPTSFGCYTSALEGEHIPLAGLIYGSLERPPSFLARARQDLHRRRRGAFGPYNLSYLRRFDVLLVIYQLSNDDELVRFVQRARSALPDTLLVSCSSPPFGRLRAHWKDHHGTAERYRAFLNATHVNMNVCRATVPYYRLLTDTPSLYLPQPYPVEYALQQVDRTQGIGHGERAASDAEGSAAGPAMWDAPSGLSDRAATVSRSKSGTSEGAFSEPASVGPAKKARGAHELGASRSSRLIIYVAGDTVRPDIMSGHLIAKVLQERHPEVRIRVTQTPEFHLNTAFLKGTRYDVVPFRTWAEQLRELATVRLVINTDLWWTRGRVPVDCAAAGVPCVGTTSDGQTELWPDLAAADSLDTDRLLALAERALTDETFRETAVTKARRRLPHYAYGPTVERFTRAVALARTGRLPEWRDPVWDGDVLKNPT